MSASPQHGYTTADVARRYRVSEDKVRAWIRLGELRAVNTSANLCGRPRWIVSAEALAAFEARRAGVQPAMPIRRRRPAGRDWFPDGGEA